MLFYIYIIYSSKSDRYYVGHTDNVLKRIEQHNSGMSTYTSKASDWKLVYTEEFNSRKLASLRETEIKRKKSRKYIEWLVAG